MGGLLIRVPPQVGSYPEDCDYFCPVCAFKKQDESDNAEKGKQTAKSGPLAAMLRCLRSTHSLCVFGRRSLMVM